MTSILKSKFLVVPWTGLVGSGVVGSIISLIARNTTAAPCHGCVLMCHASFCNVSSKIVVDLDVPMVNRQLSRCVMGAL